MAVHVFRECVLAGLTVLPNPDEIQVCLSAVIAAPLVSHGVLLLRLVIQVKLLSVYEQGRAVGWSGVMPGVDTVVVSLSTGHVFLVLFVFVLCVVAT